jgi:predicted lipoprotein with Yx(FWY)xxD motif
MEVLSTMKRHIWKLAAAASLGVVLLSGCSGGTTPAQTAGTGASAQSSATTGSAVLATGQSSLGTIIVNGQGMTAYVFDHDTAGSGTSTCTGPCTSLWPAITAPSATPSISGITGTVGTITLPNKTLQVTVNGLPLYTYAPDTKPGDDSGQGYGGIWWVVGADGTKIGATPTTGPSTSSSSGSGY